MLKRPMCLIGLAVVLITHLFMQILARPAPEERTGFHEGQYVCLIGQVSQKEIKNGNSIIYLKKTVIQQPIESSHETYSIIAYLAEATQVRLGSTIALEGKVNLFDAAENEGQFDAAQYYEINGIDFSVTKAYVTGASKEYSQWKETLYQFRERLKSVYAQALPEKEAGILYALLLGDKSMLDADIKELYMRAGIVHILSLSGVKTELLAYRKWLKDRINTAFVDAFTEQNYIVFSYKIKDMYETL